MNRFLVLAALGLLSIQDALAAEPAPKSYQLAKRASEIDPRTKEHPKIGFVFTDPKGKVMDLQHAVVDTRVAAQGKLVIWLMDHNAGMFERVSSFGLHGSTMPTAGFRA